MTFREFFRQATGGLAPYRWQERAAEEGLPDILDVPTGWGKTEGVVTAWAWRRFVVGDPAEPPRLVYCLPMRVLVRQTTERLRALLDRLYGLIDHEVPTYALMGGQIEDEWANLPDKPWVLVGTQDQLLSRALNRGYAMSRYRWPVHFGVLNNDCRWVVDEVQLLGPGLWTTAQLDWMRRNRFGCFGPCPTTWMSATPGYGFLSTVDRVQDGLDRTVRRLAMDNSDDGNEQSARLLAARRAVDLATVGPDELAGRVTAEHAAGTLSLVVCNTVSSARDVFDALGGDERSVLITSRFRAVDRAAAEDRLLEFERLRREAGGRRVADHRGLICVSTQVIEAGVDISAHRMWSELAPWPSVVQRLGRLNRDGADQQAKATFWYPDAVGSATGRVGPYRKSDIDSALKLTKKLSDLSANQPAMRALRQLTGQGNYAALVEKALEPELTALPRAFDVHGLFSTDPDLHGGFTDISEFIRGLDPDPDVTVVWRNWIDDDMLQGDLVGPPIDVYREGCPVHVRDLTELLRRLKKDKRQLTAWTWNDDRGLWSRVVQDEICPGMTIMLPSAAGGYNSVKGWTGEINDYIDDLDPPGPGRKYEDDIESESGYWCGLEDHLVDAAEQAKVLVDRTGIEGTLRQAVIDAAQYHDLGKAHPRWQDEIPGFKWMLDSRRQLLSDALQATAFAKFPHVIQAQGSALALQKIAASLAEPGVAAMALGDRQVEDRAAWLLASRLSRSHLEKLRHIPGVVKVTHVQFRPGLRHEAATALAMWDRYRSGTASWSALAIYLAAAHHGKVRMTMRSRSGDDVCGVPRSPDSLSVRAEKWPLDFAVASDGAEGEWTDNGFRLHDQGWTALVADLLGPWRGDGREPWNTGVVPDGEPKALGPFRLAYLEALVRVADWRASSEPSSSVSVTETPQ